MRLLTVRSMFAAAALLVVSASAQAAPLFFGGAGFNWLAGGSLATPNHIWTTGDYWDQSFSGTGITNTAAMGVNVFVDDNTLAAADQVNLDVLLNGSNVGSFSILAGTTGNVAKSFTFSSVAATAGQTFDIKFLETNTVPGGHGSVSMGLDQRSWAELRPGTPTPEANTLALMGLGFLGLAGISLRRRA
jgi:hypothetical protein